MAFEQPGRKKKKSRAGGPARPKRDAASDLPPAGASAVRARKVAGQDAWELVPPRCARDRKEDLEEVEKMIAAGEIDVAVDECRWLLSGCSDCLDAHRLLGEIALGENDLQLARGHFGYAYRLGERAIAQAGNPSPVPYRLAANRSFFESGKGLAWCLRQMGKREMVGEVVALLLRCDPSDPLGIRQLLAESPGHGPEQVE